jgi:hypothetical protein
MSAISKITISVLLASALTVSAAPSFAQEFTAYEGKKAIAEGDGGAKKTVEGIDFWSDGSPPRKFKLLGYITDTRNKSGLVGMISMSNLEGSIADVAKKNGGDAVLLLSSEAETLGMFGGSFGGAQGTATVNRNTVTGSSTGWGSGMARAIQKQHTKYAVLKYLPDESPASPGAIQESTAIQPSAVQAVASANVPTAEAQ